MTSEQKMELLKANVSNAKFHFYTKFRGQLQDCEANDIMLCAELEDRLLPITFENLEAVWLSFSPAQQAAYAKPTNVVRPRPKKPEAPAAVVINADDVLDKAGELPAAYTRQRILLELNASEYRALRKQYGDAKIESRVNGQGE